MTEDQQAMLLLQIELLKELNADLTPEKRLILLDKLSETVLSFTSARTEKMRRASERRQWATETPAPLP